MQSCPGVWCYDLGIIFSNVSIIRLENEILQLKELVHYGFVLGKWFQVLIIIIHEITY